MTNNFKLICMYILVSLLVLIVLIGVFFSKSLSGINEILFYWLELVILIYLAIVTKISDGNFLYGGIILVSIGAILNIFGVSFAEQIFRFSMGFWIVGIGLSFIKLKK